MQQFILNPNELLGGVFGRDDNQELVQLALQKGNEIPPYQSDAIILLILLNGKAEVRTDNETFVMEGLQVVRIEPDEEHSIKALEDKTAIIVVKQLIHSNNNPRHVLFANCAYQ